MGFACVLLGLLHGLEKENGVEGLATTSKAGGLDIDIDHGI